MSVSGIRKSPPDTADQAEGHVRSEAEAPTVRSLFDAGVRLSLLIMLTPTVFKGNFVSLF